MFAFVEKHKAKAKATYLLAGWTKAEPSQHVVTLVDQDKLLKSRDALAPVTSLHVYSIQPTQPKVSSTSLAANHIRTHQKTGKFSNDAISIAPECITRVDCAAVAKSANKATGNDEATACCS